jgi:hypothetical protein
MGNLRKVSHPYHTSLREPAVELKQRPSEYRGEDGSAAFVLNLVTNLHRTGGVLPDPYDTCDVLYTEMAWERGYPIFAERAGLRSVDFDAYVKAIAAIAENEKAPAVIITGKKALRRLPTPALQMEAWINSGGLVIATGAVAAFYRMSTVPTCARSGDGSTLSLLEGLATIYRRIGDPCCGFGNAGRVFAGAGRNFVMSDVNRDCIRFVAQHAPGWRKARA